MQPQELTQQDMAPAEEVMHAYTRSDMLLDGSLVDVTKMASEAGFRVPVALTVAAWTDCVAWSDEDTKRQKVPQDEEGRLWDVLHMCMQTIRHANVESTFYFLLYRVPCGGRATRPRLTRLKAVTHGGDQGEQVVTIMLPEED